MGLDAYKTTMQHGKENTKQILDINSKKAQTRTKYERSNNSSTRFSF